MRFFNMSVKAYWQYDGAKIRNFLERRSMSG